MIVVDASALVEVLLQTPPARDIEDRLFGDGEALHAPHLIDIEVAHAIRRYAIGGQVDGERGRAEHGGAAHLSLGAAEIGAAIIAERRLRAA